MSPDLKRYRLNTLIGSGAMGDIHQATDTITGQTVAVKQLKTSLVKHKPDILERFRREGELLRQLNHPNIVKILDTFEQDGEHYLVMEYVAGGDLKTLLEAGPLSLEQALAFSIDLADALTRAHKLNIIHRDIKPANILVDEDGELRLTDFGIAHLGDRQKITEAGAILGTVAYLSPEACLGEPIDSRADIWAFGVVIYQMLTRQHPFLSESAASTLANILNAPFPDPKKVRPDLPDELNDLIYRMLEKSPEGRIPSVRLVGAAIESILQGIARQSSDFKNPVPPQASAFDTPTPTTGKIANNLPLQTIPFVGRQAELTELARLIADKDIRLITLLGPGGMGKSRLAIEAGQQSLGQFPDGVYFVALAPISKADNIPAAIAKATDYRFDETSEQKTQILNYLSNKELLLIMDNFEHLLECSSLLNEILAAAPNITILVTSRIRLNLTGEFMFALSGMEFPEWETSADALEYSAVQLFAQSARRSRIDFKLADVNRTNLVRICRLVEGVPLALLLAAAWVNTLSLAEIADEIQAGIDFLEHNRQDLPERQRSMRAAMDYTWRLLADEERVAFARMSVFRGGCTRRAGQKISRTSIRMLTTLVNKSLLWRNHESGRFEIHELLRQYGAERLQATDEATAIHDAHATHYLSALAGREADLKGVNQPGALDDVEKDFENVRAAWSWAVEKHRDDLLQGASEALYIFSRIRSRNLDSLEMFGQLREQMRGEESFLAALAIGYHEQILYMVQGFQNEMIQNAKAVMAFVEKINEPVINAFALSHMGNVLIKAQKWRRAIPYLEKSLSLYEELDDLYHQANVFHDLGLAYSSLGDGQKSAEMNRRCLQLRRKLNDLHGIADSMNNLSSELNDSREAERRHEEIYNIRKKLGAKKGMAWSGVAVAIQAIVNGNPEKAKRFVTEALEIVEKINDAQATMWVLAVYQYMLIVEERYGEMAPVIEKMEQLPVNRLEMLVNIPSGRYIAAIAREDYESAKSHFKEVVRFTEVPTGANYCGMLAALLLEKEGKHELALTLCQAGLKIWDAWKVVPLVTRMLGRGKKTLPADAYRAALARGEDINSEEIIIILSDEGLL